jgi:hypothetical protein
MYYRFRVLRHNVAEFTFFLGDPQGLAEPGLTTSVEAWPRHHVMTPLLGFVLQKAEDFVASFIVQHNYHPICLLLLPSS